MTQQKKLIDEAEARRLVEAYGKRFQGSASTGRALQSGSRKIFLGDSIPEKKLRNASSAFANLDDDEVPLVLIDNTVFGSGKGGIVLSNSSLHGGHPGLSSKHMPLDEIRSVSVHADDINSDLVVNDQLFWSVHLLKPQSMKIFAEMLGDVIGFMRDESVAEEIPEAAEDRPRTDRQIRQPEAEVEVVSKARKVSRAPVTLPTEDSVRTIVAIKAINSALVSLALWGVINTGAWYFIGASSREVLGELTNPSVVILFLMYAGVGFGGMLLLFTILGLVARNMLGLWLNGIALLSVGAGNVLILTVTPSVLEPYGLAVDITSPLNAFWVLLGLGQIVWGFSSIAKANRIKSPDKTLAGTQRLSDDESVLQSLITEDRSVDGVAFKFGMKGPWRPFTSRATEYYTAFVDGEQLLCIKHDLHDYLTFERKSVSLDPRDLSKGVSVVIGSSAAGNKTNLTLNWKAYRGFRQWMYPDFQDGTPESLLCTHCGDAAADNLIMESGALLCLGCGNTYYVPNSG